LSLCVRQQGEGPNGKVLGQVGNIVEKIEIGWSVVERSSWAF